MSGSQLLTPQTTLTATIPAYPYKQYADDDDIQAFFAAYNAATQTYIDWFNSVNLPYYPGLSGPILDWVLNGLYGTQRTSLVQSASAAAGPLNTEELNTATLNSFTAPTTTYYSITDDVLKRILTWNYYKGDGKRFTMKWLKRRIMRFLIGTDGLNPNPLDPLFVIGPENTQAISVTVSSDVLTVTINGAAISSLVQLQPNILPIFQSAFLGGVLDLPAQYNYAVNIITQMTATVSPTSESVTGIATTLSTGTASVSALGGNGAYTFAWTWDSGGTGITINSPSLADTSFTATGMTRGTTLSGVAKCTVTDTASHTAFAFVNVTIRNVSVPSVSLSPNSFSITGISSTEATSNTTSTITGGQGPFSYAWTWQTGGAGITIGSPSASATNFSASGLTPGQTVSGTALLTITDFYGQQATATCSVSLSRATMVSASCSPTSETSSSSTQPITTGSTTVSASGGSGSYTYAWTWQSGGTDISINSPSSATTSFTGSGMTPGQNATGVAQCVVTDGFGQQSITTCSVSITYLPPLTFTYTSAQTVTVPSGYSTAVIEEWGGGGGGQGGTGSLCTASRGAGGGGAGYVRHQASVTGGQSITISSVGAAGSAGIGNGGVGTAGGTTVVVIAATTLTANGGQQGNVSGGTGGTASGGNQANVTGGSGGPAGSPSSNAGTTQNGVYANNPAGNGVGGAGGRQGTNPGAAGGGGLVAIHFT